MFTLFFFICLLFIILHLGESKTASAISLGEINMK